MHSGLLRVLTNEYDSDFSSCGELNECMLDTLIGAAVMPLFLQCAHLSTTVALSYSDLLFL